MYAWARIEHCTVLLGVERGECRFTGSRSDSWRAAKLLLLRGERIFRIRLDKGVGHIPQIGKALHHTRWPFAAFEVTGNYSPAPP